MYTWSCEGATEPWLLTVNSYTRQCVPLSPVGGVAGTWGRVEISRAQKEGVQGEGSQRGTHLVRTCR